MNGGLLHAVQAFTADEVDAAVNGFRYFGLDAAASVIEDVASRWAEADNLALEEEEELEGDADEQFAEATRIDDDMVSAFKAKYAVEPNAFAELSEEDLGLNAEAAAWFTDLVEDIDKEHSGREPLSDTEGVERSE